MKNCKQALTELRTAYWSCLCLLTSGNDISVPGSWKVHDFPNLFLPTGWWTARKGLKTLRLVSWSCRLAVYVHCQARLEALTQDLWIIQFSPASSLPNGSDLLDGIWKHWVRQPLFWFIQSFPDKFRNQFCSVLLCLLHSLSDTLRWHP